MRVTSGPCSLPRGSIADCLEVRGDCQEVSSRVASKSHVRVASRSQGTNFETKIFSYNRCFWALPTETSFTTPHYLPKYEVWAIEILFVVGSL